MAGLPPDAFTVAGTRYEGPDPDSDGDEVKRTTLKRLKLEPGAEFEYEYDFGDDWRHAITVEERQPRVADVTYPSCSDGERAGPPEDCGGPPGYDDLLRALRDPAHPEHADMVVWAGAWAPEVFDLRAVNRILRLAFPVRGG